MLDGLAEKGGVWTVPKSLTVEGRRGFVSFCFRI